MLLHWIWLATRPDISDREKVQILSHFRDAEDVFFADSSAYRQIEGLSIRASEVLQDKNLSEAGRILKDCTEKNIHICTYCDAAYPGRLKNIADPPLVLYYKGRLPDFDGRPVIGVVGTRQCTAYGIHVARKMGGQIARCGGIVVSGAAKGIDAAAMSGALSADGFAVGVLGNGADIVYPRENRGLFEDTQRYGCLLSEFPPQTPPYRWNFPKRNRIISGLSNGVLIVEAPKGSGALITAREAADQGRDVFVVPGNIDMPTCEGSNALLREGAISVSRGWDAVSEYSHLYPDAIRPDYAVIPKPGFTDDVMASAKGENTPPAKVAQKGAVPAKSSHSDRKKEKKPIDNGEKPPYSDIHDALAGLNPQQQTIAKLLLEGEQLVDDVIARSGLAAPAVLAALTVMEIKGIVRRLPGKRVALK